MRSLRACATRERLVAGAIHRMSGSGRDIGASLPVNQRMDPEELTAYYGHLPWSVSANLAVRREVFAAVGGFNEQLTGACDADLCWRLAERGVTLAYEPAAILFKRPRNGALPTFCRYLQYGLDHPLLFRMHRDSGMPRRSLRGATRRYLGTAAGIAHGLRHPRSPSTIPAAARCGQDLGRLIGSVRWRSLYL